MDWFDPDRVLRSPLAAGTIGSIVSLRFSPGASKIERVLNIVAGAALAGFASPAAAEYFALKTPAMQSAVAFAVGLFGMNLVATIFAWIKDAKLGDFLPWLKKG